MSKRSAGRFLLFDVIVRMRTSNSAPRRSFCAAFCLGVLLCLSATSAAWLRAQNASPDDQESSARERVIAMFERYRQAARLNDVDALYAAHSTEAREHLPLEQFRQLWENHDPAFKRGLSEATLQSFRFGDDYASAVMELGSTERFLALFVEEGGEWKLHGVMTEAEAASDPRFLYDERVLAQVLNEVSDDSEFKLDEAYLYLLWVVTRFDHDHWEQLIEKELSVAELLAASEQHRGRFLVAEGIVLEASQLDLPRESTDIARVYEFFLYRPETKEMIRIHTPGPVPGFHLRKDRMRFYGVYLRMVRHETETGEEVKTPLLLCGRADRVEPPPQSGGDSGQTTEPAEAAEPAVPKVVARTPRRAYELYQWAVLEGVPKRAYALLPTSVQQKQAYEDFLRTWEEDSLSYATLLAETHWEDVEVVQRDQDKAAGILHLSGGLDAGVFFTREANGWRIELRWE